MGSPLPQQRWQHRNRDGSPQRFQAQAQQLAQTLGLLPLVAEILVQRGITTPAEARSFIEPDTLTLPPPSQDFPDLALAVDLLAQAIEQKTPMAICGDYDADGMTSTALLLRALRHFGAIVHYDIPSRMAEGYGINDRMVQDLHQQGVGLILTVDNGIAAHQPIALARELGLVVIITDHHDLPPELPTANAILNPKLLEVTSPYRGLAGVGVAYVLAQSLGEALGCDTSFQPAALDLFTLGTIADMAPLVGVNRTWVKRGLAHLPQSPILGIQALIHQTHLKTKAQRNFQPQDIGFKLGPRINAIGRIGNPQVVIELFTTEDPAEADRLAEICETTNQTRQSLCQDIEREAVAHCEEHLAQIHQQRVLTLCYPNWHHGVIGIVASRLVERYGLPVFIATLEDTDHIRGSARGIPEFSIFDALHAAGDLLDRYGGHPAAGGFSLHREQWPAFQERLSQFAHQCLEPDHLQPLIALDAKTQLGDLTWDLYHQLETLQPWGVGNPEPLFWATGVTVVKQQCLGPEQQHLKLWVKDGSGQGFVAMCWRGGHYYPLPERVDLGFLLSENEWQGDRSLQLDIKGIRASSTSEAVDHEVAAIPRLGQFIHNDRPYHCGLYDIAGHQGKTQELRIRNDRGVVLAITQGSSHGLLGNDRHSAQTIDVRQAPFGELILLARQALGGF